MQEFTGEWPLGDLVEQYGSLFVGEMRIDLFHRSIISREESMVYWLLYNNYQNIAMSSNELSLEHQDPIVIAIGGTGASREVMSEYYTHLVTRSAPDVPLEDKFFELSEGGYGHLQDTYDELEERMRTMRRTHLGRKVIAFGHSQGGVHAARLGLDGHLDAVIAAAAPIRGGVAKNLPSLNGDNEAAKRLEDELAPGSVFMMELREGMESHWPQSVPLYVVAATYDIVVPREAQFGVKAIETRDYIVVPSGLALMGNLAVMAATGVPAHTRHIHSGLPVDHFSLPRATGMPRFIDRVVTELN